MINAPKSVREINSFKFVSVPSPRDVFIKYGQRQASGHYSTDGETVATPAIVNRSSVIEETINAEVMLRRSLEQNKP